MEEPSHTYKGFTLVELAIVLTILGLVVLVTVPLFTALDKRERAKKTKEEMQEIKQAVIQFYRDHLRIPYPETPCNYYGVPINALSLPASARYDEIKGACYLYVATNNGTPFDSLYVDGRSIGSTAMVIVSRGHNASFDLENANPSNGRFSTTGGAGFDDIVVYLSESELRAATYYMREVFEDVSVLNEAATILARNDDDVDGYVDEDPPGSPCLPTDPPGDCDGLTNWSLIDAGGVDALIRAGLITDPGYAVDPWGSRYIWNQSTHRFYSAGPNRLDENCGGDDICP